VKGTPKKKTTAKHKVVRSGTGDRLKKQWIQKKPVIFFILGFAVFMILFYLLWFSDFYTQQIQPHIVHVNAVISNAVLRVFGFNTVVRGSTVESSLFSVNILKGCDAVEAIALVSAALLSFPAKWKHKLVGFLTGAAILFALNLVRIISLFITGVYVPSIFETMHVEVWQFVFILVAVGIWIFWIKWCKKRVPHV